jgi:hypothetical protein
MVAGAAMARQDERKVTLQCVPAVGISAANFY